MPSTVTSVLMSIEFNSSPCEVCVIIIVGKIDISDQNSCLALIAPSVHIYEPVCTSHLWDVYQGRAADQLWDCQPRMGVERKHPFSSLLHSWYIIGQMSASHQGLTH